MKLNDDTLMRDIWALIETWRKRKRQSPKHAGVLARCIHELAERIPIPSVPQQRRHTDAYIRKQRAKHQQWDRNLKESDRVRRQEERAQAWARWMKLDPAVRKKWREREKRARDRVRRLYGPSAPFQSLIPKRPRNAASPQTSVSDCGLSGGQPLSHPSAGSA
jgi:hypothetical protein